MTIIRGSIDPSGNWHDQPIKRSFSDAHTRAIRRRNRARRIARAGSIAGDLTAIIRLHDIGDVEQIRCATGTFVHFGRHFSHLEIGVIEPVLKP